MNIIDQRITNLFFINDYSVATIFRKKVIPQKAVIVVGILCASSERSTALYLPGLVRTTSTFDNVLFFSLPFILFYPIWPLVSSFWFTKICFWYSYKEVCCFKFYGICYTGGTVYLCLTSFEPTWLLIAVIYYTFWSPYVYFI